LGDTLQFIRYAARVKDRGATVVVRVPQQLARLLGRSPGIDRLVSGERFDDFDVHLPLMSLPRIFGTTAETIPSQVPYLFADEELVERWRKELWPLRAGRTGAGGGPAKARASNLLVGIAWQGNPRYPADRLRSIPLKHFAPLASLPGIRLINLQKGFGTEQLLDLAGLFSVSEPVSDVDRTRGRFMDTAAMMMNLDLVVTSDTAVAHLAGGLGVPVWVAIPYAPDWRWLLEREDSPWYPTMRLFRQTAPGDWEGVFRRIRRELRRFSPRSRTDSDDSSKPKRSPPAPEDRGESPAVPTTGQAHSTPVHVPPSALVEHGVRLADAGRLRQAFFAFKCVVWLDPCSVDGHYNLGTVLHRLGRFAEAAASFRRCLRVAPRYAEARTNLAVALAELGQAEQAEKELRIAIRRLPRNVEAHYSLGNVLASQGRWEEALDRFRYVMELGPDFAQGHYGAANVYHQQARFDRALAAYDRALQLQPHFKEARRLRAATRLLTGDVERGWPDYAPLSPGQFGSDEPDRTSQEPGSESNRRWHLTAGHDLAENLILLRYAELAKRNGASISVVCRAEQQAIVGGCRGVDSTRARGGEPPAADLYASLAALPSLLGSPAVGQTSRTPFLSLDPALVEAWRNLLDPLGGLKIGVYWQCDARDGNVPEAWIDALAQVPQVRLVDLGALADGPLALDANAGSQPKKRRSSGQAPGPTNLPRVSRGGRQHGTPAGLSGGVEGRGAKGLTTTMSGAVIPQVETFADLAAVIANLDLVIATDGVCAHLAGALDVPLYVPLPVVPKWYWLLHREDSPWYPCARLFRQSRRGEWDDVCQRIRQAIADLLAGDPTAESTRYDNADRLCAKGLASLERGEVHESLAWFERAVEAAPAYAAAHNNLGSALARLGRHDEAASAYRMALKRRPNYPEALVNLGIALANLGQHDEAIRSFRLAVRQRPEWARGHFYLGNGLVALGQWHAALASYREGHRLAPHDEDLRLNLGVALRQTGRLEEAATVLEGLLSQQPDHVDALNNLAVAYCRGQQYWKALERLQQVLRLSPGFAAAHNNLGIVLAHLERYGDAIAAYQRALSISPDYAEAYNNLGIALTREGRFSEALGSFERALRLRPDYPQALNNRGIALRELGRVDEALAGYERALSGDPDYTDAHLNRAFVLLLRGDWQRGWQEYEWRFKHRPSAEKRFAQPAWQGEPLDGRTLLICCEQGLGDALQFIRFTALAKQRGARVVVRCPKRMINLLSRASHIDLLVGEEDKLPSFDCHAPLLSLPRILGTTLETLPNEVPYLSADPELVEHWRARVREDRGAVRGPAGAGYDGDELLVGINWQGNAHYEGDRHRSFPMTCFAPLASVAGVRLLSLQKGVGQEQLARLHARPGGIGRHRDLEIAVQPPGVASRRDEIQGFTIADLGPDVDESRGAFMDTAAVMMHLDLVITSDTSVAHLAGALGRPVWVALPFSADWRWLLRRDDSPWYPTMRLYRQPARGDWEAVFQRIKDDLTELVTAQIGNDLAE
jgi:tetratricopeptide (TPR) repeat protein